jgi:tetratricopeptide (TPR) repeat protein
MKKSFLEKTLKKDHGIKVLIIFILAFLIRFVYIQGIKNSPLFYYPTMDSLYHLNWAKQILAGNAFARAPYYRAPLYVFFLTFLLEMFQRSLYIVRIVQILMDSLSCVLIYLLGRKMFNSRIGLGAGILGCLYFPFVYFSGELVDATLLVFLDLVLLILLLRTQKHPSLWKFLGCGALLGLSADARPNILLFGVAIPFWTWFAFKDKIPLKKILIFIFSFAMGVLLLVLPVTSVNYLAGKDLVLIAWNGGINFYIGNNSEASGYKAVAPEMRQTWWGGYFDSIEQAEKALGRILKPSEVSNYWFHKGFEFIFQNPFSYIKLMLKKIFLFFGGEEMSNNQSFYFFANFSPLAKILLWRRIISFPSGIILPLSLMGLVLAYQHWKKYSIVLIFIFSYTLSVVLFFVCSRYRQPVMPFLLIFASFAIFWFWGQKRLKDKLIMGSFLLGLMIVENVTVIDQFSPIWDAQAHVTLGSSYVRAKLYDQAEEEYKKALIFYSDDSNALSGLGLIQYIRGNYEESRNLFEKAVRLNPQDEYAHRYLGDIYRKSEDFQKALEEYKKALKLDPEYGEAYFGAGMAYANLNQIPEAIKMWEKLLEYYPNFELAKENIARAKRNLERMRKAKETK